MYPYSPSRKFSIEFFSLKSITNNIKKYKGYTYPVLNMNGFMVIKKLQRQAQSSYRIISGIYSGYETLNNKKKKTLFLNQFSTIISDPISSEVTAIFNYIQSKINRNNKIPFHVIKRFSGTQGLTVLDIDFYQCIKHPGLLPKTTTGYKIIKERNL